MIHQLLYDIVSDLTDPLRKTYINKPTDRIFWKDANGRNVLISEELSKTQIHSSEENVRYYSDILKEESRKYYSSLISASCSELKRTQQIREQELEHFYQVASEQIKRLGEELPLPDVHRINALWDLTQIYIIESVVVYHDNHVKGFMHPFFCSLLPQEIDALAEVARIELNMDFNEARLLLLTCPSSSKKNKTYDLLADYPKASEYLSRLTGEYLDNNLKPLMKTKKVDLAIIASGVSELLSAKPTLWKYFEAFWGVSDLHGSYKQVNRKGKTSPILNKLFIKRANGVNGVITDDDLIKQYNSRFQQ